MCDLNEVKGMKLKMINKKWDIILKDEFQKQYFKELGIFVKKEYKSKQIFPPYENIFDALRFTDYDEVKVVILGQDPYHGLGEAHGLSFSVHNNIKNPPSLINILKRFFHSNLYVIRYNRSYFLRICSVIIEYFNDRTN